jgi:hypothetical protein
MAWRRDILIRIHAREKAMTTTKLILAAACTMWLTGCGVEVATTAATTAAIKKQEIEAGKQMKDMADKKIEAATQAMQQHADEQSKADK